MTAPIRLVLVDDHPIVLQGLVQVLTARPELAIVATCADGAAAVPLIRQHRPDVAVLDARLPGLDGVGIVRALHGDAGPTRFVLLTASLDPRELTTALDLGVRGVVFKDQPVDTLIECIREVHAGRTWNATAPAPSADAAGLTAREVEIVRLIVDGQRNKQIAVTLGITEGTVKVHLHRIYEKLGLDGRVELMLWAQSNRLP